MRISDWSSDVCSSDLQAGSLRSDLPTTIEDAYTWPVVGERIAEADLSERVDDAIDRLPAELDDEQITRYAEDLLGRLLTTVVVLVTALAVMLDGEAMFKRLRDLFSGEQQERLAATGTVG